MRWLALVLALVPATALAQETRALRDGWTLHSRIGVTGLQDVACGHDRAYARSWPGAIAIWDGSSWSAPPVDRQTSRYGRTLAVAPNGHAFLEAGAGVAEWTGTQWIDHALPSWEGDLGAQIAAVSASEVYTVGRGRLARFDGRAFTTYDAGTWRSLAAVAAIDGALFVGGQGGTIMRHDGRAWAREPTGIETNVRRIVAFGASDVWAWAEGPSWRESIVLHFDGRRWERRDPALGAAIDAIGGTAHRVYVTGDFGLAHWSGSAWQVELAPADLGEGYHALHGVCATDHHFVVGDTGGGALVRPRS